MGEPGRAEAKRPERGAGLLPHYLPTPAEIAAECAAIQAGWTDAERESRWMGRKRVDVQYGRVRRIGSDED